MEAAIIGKRLEANGGIKIQGERLDMIRFAVSYVMKKYKVKYAKPSLLLIRSKIYNCL